MRHAIRHARTTTTTANTAKETNRNVVSPRIANNGNVAIHARPSRPIAKNTICDGVA
jgi:hypothetical protein